MRVVQLLVLVALVAGALAAPKYASNGGTAVGTTAAALTGPSGFVPESSLEWFRYTSTTQGCYRLWATTVTACEGVLPGPTDDVILGYGTGSAAAAEYLLDLAIYFSFNHPKLNCNPTVTGPCLGVGDIAQPQTTRPWNANISTLTFRQRTTSVPLGTAANPSLTPIVFTGYPKTTGAYSIAATAWTVTGSTKLTVINGVFVQHPNVGIYGSGYGVNLGGISAGSAGGYGNRAFSAQSTYGVDARAGARNGLTTTDADAVTLGSSTTNQEAVRAGYGFILETPSILIDSCQYGTAGATTRCTAYAATEIQGPNLYVQPTPVNLTDVASLIAADNTFAGRRVNITVAANSVLFTTATNYINVDFYVRQDGFLAFCEPSRRDPAVAAPAGQGGFLAAAASNAFTNRGDITSGDAADQQFQNTDSGHNSYTLRGDVLASCSAVETVAYDWFGTAFTSVRVFNADTRMDNILYSEVIPHLAKLVFRYGSTYTVPVVGNVTIDILATDQASVTENVPGAANSGRVTVAGTASQPIQGNLAAPANSGRFRPFLGMAIPFGPYDDTANEIPLVQSFDCTAHAAGTFAAGNGAYTGMATAQCDGTHIPSRFTFFGGVATIQRPAAPSADTAAVRQLIALTQFDLLVAGDGYQFSQLVFGQLVSSPGAVYQVCGNFAARSNGVVTFTNNHPVLLSSKINLNDGRPAGTNVILPRGDMFSTAAATATTISAAYPALPDTTGVTAETITPVPRRAAGACAERYTYAQTGAGCTLGTYSFLYTVPNAAATTNAVAERPLVTQFKCSAGACASNAASVIDPGCYTTAFAGALPASTAPVAPVNTRGYCTSWTVGAVTTYTGIPGNDAIPALCPAPVFSGLSAFPANNVSNATVGQIVFNSATTVNDVNATVQATQALVRSTFAVTSFQDVNTIGVALSATTGSTMIVGSFGDLRVDGAAAALSTDAASFLDVATGGRLSLAGGSLGGGNFRVAGTLNFVTGTTSSVISAGGVDTTLSGSGSVSVQGTATIVGTVTSSIAATTVSQGGVVNIQGTYTQTAGNFTILDGGVIGSTVATGSLVLSGSANLVFAAPVSGTAVGAGISAAGPVAQLSVTLASATNQVIIPAGASVVAAVPLTITSAGNGTAQLLVAGNLTLQAASTISANSLITGALFGSPSFLVTLAGNTTAAGILGRAAQRFQIGSAARAGVLRLVGGSFAGVYTLQTASYAVVAGTVEITDAVVVAPADGVTATTTTAASAEGNAVAFFTAPGSQLTISAPFTPNVDVINSGTITVGANQVLTVTNGRTLRLRNGVVTGAGSVVIASGSPASQVVVDSGANNQLTPASLINNAVITVASGATLTVTSCISGSGSIQGTGSVVFSTSTGCLSNTGVSRLSNLVLNSGTTTTVGAGLTIITGQVSGQGVIVASNGGFIAINNNQALTLTVTGSPQIGSATGAQDGVVVAGTITTGANTLILGAATVGTRPEVSPYTPVSSTGVTLVLNGNLQLVGTLLVPTGASLNATGTISGTGALAVQGSLVVVSALQVSVANVTVTGTLIGSTTTSVLTLGANTVLSLTSGASVGRITITGGIVSASGAFVFGQNVTIASQLVLNGSLVIPAGVTFRAQGVVVCNNGATITAQTGGRVIFETFYIGCVVSGDAFSGAGLPGNSTTVVNATMAGALILGANGLTIPVNTNITVFQLTQLQCLPTTIRCPFNVQGNLTLVFAFACFENQNAASPAAISSCRLAGIFTTTANVDTLITGTLRLVNFVSLVARQDVPTYPVGTFGTLTFGPTANTIIITNGAQINPVIVLNTLTLGGTLQIFTQSFVPLRPTVIFRALNQGNAARGVTGAFSSVVINYDQDRSAHPWAWNVGFPTVRVVNNDVVLDPNGNGTNGASAAVPSFLVALLAVIAAFFLRN